MKRVRLIQHNLLFLAEEEPEEDKNNLYRELEITTVIAQSIPGYLINRCQQIRIRDAFQKQRIHNTTKAPPANDSAQNEMSLETIPMKSSEIHRMMREENLSSGQSSEPRAVRLSLSQTAYIQDSGGERGALIITLVEPLNEIRSLIVFDCQDVIVARFCSGYFEQILLIPHTTASSSTLEYMIQHSVLLDGEFMWVGKGGATITARSLESNGNVRFSPQTLEIHFAKIDHIDSYAESAPDIKGKKSDWLSVLEESAAEAFKAQEKCVEIHERQHTKQQSLLRKTEHAIRELSNKPAIPSLYVSTWKAEIVPSNASRNTSNTGSAPKGNACMLMHVGLVARIPGFYQDIFFHLVEPPLPTSKVVESIETESGIVPNLDDHREYTVLVGAQLRGISLDIRDVTLCLQATWKAEGTLYTSLLSKITLPIHQFILPSRLEKCFHPGHLIVSTRKTLHDFRRPIIFEVDWDGVSINKTQLNKTEWLVKARDSLKGTFHHLGVIDGAEKDRYALYCYPSFHSDTLLRHLRNSLPTDTVFALI